MTKAERVKALMGRTHAAVKDEKILTAASDDMLKALEDGADAADKAEKDANEKAEKEKKEQEERDAAKKKAAAEGKDDGADDDEDDAAADKGKKRTAEGERKIEEPPMTEEKWLETAPPSIRDMVARHKAADAKAKDALVGKLKTAQTVFTEAQLKTKSVEQLEEIAALVKVETAPVDFSGRAPRAAEENDYITQPPPDGYKIALEKQRAAKQ